MLDFICLEWLFPSFSFKEIPVFDAEMCFINGGKRWILFLFKNVNPFLFIGKTEICYSSGNFLRRHTTCLFSWDRELTTYWSTHRIKVHIGEQLSFIWVRGIWMRDSLQEKNIYKDSCITKGSPSTYVSQIPRAHYTFCRQLNRMESVPSRLSSWSEPVQ